MILYGLFNLIVKESQGMKLIPSPSSYLILCPLIIRTKKGIELREEGKGHEPKLIMRVI